MSAVVLWNLQHGNSETHYESSEWISLSFSQYKCYRKKIFLHPFANPGKVPVSSRHFLTKLMELNCFDTGDRHTSNGASLAFGFALRMKLIVPQKPFLQWLIVSVRRHRWIRQRLGPCFCSTTFLLWASTFLFCYSFRCGQKKVRRSDKNMQRPKSRQKKDDENIFIFFFGMAWQFINVTLLENIGKAEMLETSSGHYKFINHITSPAAVHWMGSRMVLRTKSKSLISFHRTNSSLIWR